MGEVVLKADLTAYLDRKLNPGKVQKKIIRDLAADHDHMIQKMKSGKQLKKRSKKRYSDLSIDQFKSMKKVWEDCSRDAQSGFSLSYGMTIENIQNLIIWLTDKGYAQNSIYNVVNNLKIFLKYAYEQGYHGNDVFKHSDFSVPTEESDAIAPTYDEVVMIYKSTVKKVFAAGQGFICLWLLPCAQGEGFRAN